MFCMLEVNSSLKSLRAGSPYVVYLCAFAYYVVE